MSQPVFGLGAFLAIQSYSVFNSSLKKMAEFYLRHWGRDECVTNGGLERLRGMIRQRLALACLMDCGI